MTTAPVAGGSGVASGRGGRILVSAVVAVALVVTGAAMLKGLRPNPTKAPTVSTVNTPVPDNGVVAYYFHTSYRCSSCRKIEAYSKLAIETAFAGDLAAGRLQFRPINIEENGNGHFVEDYKLYTKSLVLSDRRSGREVRWKNLNRVWELLGNEPAFVDYVQRETHAYLDSLP